jgi:hypothetical protein
MKLVRQRHRRGCGSACLAMLVGISYYDAINFFHPNRTKKTDVSISHRALFYALLNFGFKPKLAMPTNIRRLRNFTILVVRAEEEGEAHLVIWNPIDKLIMDPWLPQPHRIEKYQKELKMIYSLRGTGRV